MPTGVLMFATFIAVVVGIRLFAGWLNHERIRRKVEEFAGTVLSITWHPFGPGWWGNSNQVIYLVRYRDADGGVHEASCQTSMFADVYFTNDRLLIPPKREEPEPQTGAEESGELQALRQENERLRRENLKLREKNGDIGATW